MLLVNSNMDLTSIRNEEICLFLASQIRAERLRRGYSQVEMATKTGISLRTYKRIELRGTGSIQNLIIILRNMERISAVKLLFPSPVRIKYPSILERVENIADIAKKKKRRE